MYCKVLNFHEFPVCILIANKRAANLQMHKYTFNNNI